jgi:predicted nucleotidyltransferase
MAVTRALVGLPPGLSVSARDLARRAGVSHPTVLSVVDKLHGQGLIKARREPKRDAYSLNRNHVLAKKLSQLIEWEGSLHDEMVRVLKNEVRKNIPEARLAVLFGSAVANGLKSTSDIDLFLLVPGALDSESRVAKLQDVVRDRFGNRLSVISANLTKKEFLKRAPRNPLWRRILEEGRPLFGQL